MLSFVANVLKITEISALAFSVIVKLSEAQKAKTRAVFMENVVAYGPRGTSTCNCQTFIEVVFGKFGDLAFEVPQRRYGRAPECSNSPWDAPMSILQHHNDDQ